MKHQVKLVIGANYGDEGKGLMSRFFAKQFAAEGKRPITVFHNGTAQRGHTADYEDGSRHVFHNFGAGTKEGSATYYADFFLVHPMDFVREANELGFVPEVYCSPACVVVTPLDMLADRIIEDYIAVKNGAREYGSCCYGSWSATDRIAERPDIAYTVSDFITGEYRRQMRELFSWVHSRLSAFGVDISKVPQWQEYLDAAHPRFANLCRNFRRDLDVFIKAASLRSFNQIWGEFDSVIFEGAQGLMLDRNIDSEWTTTSNTGIANPHRMLSDYSDFDAEACYVTRAYVTRHGDGRLSREVSPASLGENIIDRTNKYNPFQGNLRYGLLEMPEVLDRVQRDFAVASSPRYRATIAVTHCNEHSKSGGDYRSYSPSAVEKA